MDRHVLQTKASYCVPACVVMVEAWRGSLKIAPDERQEQIFAQLSHGGLCSLAAAKSIVLNEGCGEPDIRDAERIPMLSDLVRRDRRVILTCWPGKLRKILAPRGLSSPHGALPGGVAPHHALFVLGAAEESFEVYDPWHHAEGQPIRLSEDEVALVWTGMMLIATK